MVNIKQNHPCKNSAIPYKRPQQQLQRPQWHQLSQDFLAQALLAEAG